jgi:hypothetical protein
LKISLGLRQMQLKIEVFNKPLVELSPCLAAVLPNYELLLRSAANHLPAEGQPLRFAQGNIDGLWTGR